MSLSESPQEKEINPCPMTIICNTCEDMNVSGGILNAGGNVEEQEDYGFTWPFKTNSYHYRWEYQKLIYKDEKNPNVEYRQTTVENPKCESIDEKLNYKEDNLISEENRTQHAGEDETYNKGENIT